MVPLCPPTTLVLLHKTTNSSYKDVMRIQTNRTKMLLKSSPRDREISPEQCIQISRILEVEHSIILSPVHVRLTLEFFPDVVIELNDYGIDTSVRENIFHALSLFYLGTTYHHLLDAMLNEQIQAAWK